MGRFRPGTSLCPPCIVSETGFTFGETGERGKLWHGGKQIYNSRVANYSKYVYLFTALNPHFGDDYNFGDDYKFGDDYIL